MGQRGAASAEIYLDNLDNVRFPVDQLSATSRGEGLGTAMRSLVAVRIHIGAMSVGTAKCLIHDSLKHATTNSQGRTPLADVKLVQAMS